MSEVIKMLELLFYIYIIALVMIIGLIIMIIAQKNRIRRKQLTEPLIRKHIFLAIENKSFHLMNYKSERVFQSIQEVLEQIKLSDDQKNNMLKRLFSDKQLQLWMRQSKSLWPYKRLKAIYKLSFFPKYQSYLLNLINDERHPIVLFYLTYFTIASIDQEHFDKIMQKLHKMNHILLKRYATVFSNHFHDLKKYIVKYEDSKQYNHLYVLSTIASKHLSYKMPISLREHIRYIIDSKDINPHDMELVKVFLKALEMRDDSLLLTEDILHCQYGDLRQFGYNALQKQKTWSSTKKLFNFLSADSKENQYIISLIEKNLKEPQLVNRLYYYVYEVDDIVKEDALSEILSEKVEDFILKLDSDESDMAKKNLDIIIRYHHTSGLIHFINQNKNEAIEKRLFEFLSTYDTQEANDLYEIKQYVNKDILKKYNIEAKMIETGIKEKHPPELAKLIWLIIMLIIGIGFYPILSILNQIPNLKTLSFVEILKQIVLDSNYYIMFYFIIANLFYFILLIVSLKGYKLQKNLWMYKSQPMLYEEDLLPPISIIAPAYNESVNIITSVRSLLNLKYPKYEVIVVNDGSKDRTLDMLIRHFNLKRYQYNELPRLKTKTILGIYKNNDFPNLVVVNKINGGKADALNVGINISSYQYICGIDADSVLEQDALLRLMSSSLDHKELPLALGGNIVPANGCKIDHGYIEEKHFPKETLTRLQAVEYLRAFSSGRIGWSELKSLLIISGAFGLFYKDEIIDIGGYITSSGQLKKDSVGEDMELVVRLTYNRMKEKKKQYIGYVYHANCYTELPSDHKTLLKQRNRWHRGLIDILSYHRQIFLNPKYKQIGLLATPYFYLFEVLGPFFEWVGYTMLVLSLVFGLLNNLVVIGIFGLSVILGVIISLFSLYIQESQAEYMSKKDIGKLIIFAIIENFGYRQMLSIHRIYSFFTAMFEKGQWGEQKRKGI